MCTGLKMCTVTAKRTNCLLSCIRRKVARSLKEAGDICALLQGCSKATVVCSSPFSAPAHFICSVIYHLIPISLRSSRDLRQKDQSSLGYHSVGSSYTYGWSGDIYTFICFREFSPLPLSFLPRTSKLAVNLSWISKDIRNVRQLARCSEKWSEKKESGDASQEMDPVLRGKCIHHSDNFCHRKAIWINKDRVTQPLCRSSFLPGQL